MIHIQTDQGGSDWLNLKLGVVSASNISKALAKKGTDTRLRYLSDLVGQVATREQEEINAKALDWGKTNEDTARAAYEFEKGLTIEKVGFIYKDESRRFGCSPDLKISGANHYGELKCPMSSGVYIEFLAAGKIKKEYYDQIQYSLWVTGADCWDFINYNPRMKVGKMLHFVTIEKDAAMFERFENDLPEFIKDMDEMLNKIGVKFGSQWF